MPIKITATLRTLFLSLFAQVIFTQANNSPVTSAQNGAEQPYLEQPAPQHARQLLDRIVAAYPEHIMAVTDNAILWRDGTLMPLFVTQNSSAKKAVTRTLLKNRLQDSQAPVAHWKPASLIIANPTLADQLSQIYISGAPKQSPEADPGRARFEPFFRKMYGNSPQEVAQKLVTIDWMPAIFGAGTYPLRVTTVNGVDKKLQLISQELEQLVQEHPDYIPFLAKPGGTFCWRYIANTTRLSNHSFGMTIDINAQLSHYWQWDLQRAGVTTSEDAPLGYRNTIPLDIVYIFEKYGFIWGGKWYHYDTMHFEYRPELFLYS